MRYHLARTPFALLLCVLLASCSTVYGTPEAVAPSAKPGAAAPADISGQWVGIFNTHPEIIRLTVELRSAGDGSVEGEVAFAPLIDDRFHVGSMGEGRYAVRGQYDAERRTLTLTPERWIEGRRPTAPAFRGVYASGYEAFAGIIPSATAGAAQYFALAPAARAEALLLDPARHASKPRRVTRLPFGLGGQTADGDILAWASQLTEEFPERDPYRENIPEAQNLFADPYFEPYFGNTYDRINPLKRREIYLKLRGSDNPELRPLSGLAHAFQATGTPAVQATTVTVLAHRVLRSWLAGARSRLGSPTATEAGWREIAGIEETGSVVLESFWPSERDAFARALEGARTAVAEGLLVRRLADLTTTGGDLELAVGLDRALSGFPATRDPAGPSVSDPVPSAVPDLPRLWGLASRDVRREQEPRARAVISRLVEEAARTDLDGMQSWPGGVEGLVTGTRWYSQTYPRYSRFHEHPAVAELFRTFRTRRSSLLQAEAQGLTARIRRADDADEVDLIVAAYLGVPGDRQDRVGSQLLALGNERSRELRAIATRAEARKAAIGKILFAGLLEAGRRASVENDDLLVQIGTTWGRNSLIRSALQDVFPDADERALGYMVRWAGLIMEGDFSARGFTTATLRERIVQSWEEEQPDSAEMARFADFAADLFLQRMN